MQDEVIWVVLSHHIEYKRAAVLNDRIKITTYIDSSCVQSQLEWLR